LPNAQILLHRNVLFGNADQLGCEFRVIFVKRLDGILGIRKHTRSVFGQIGAKYRIQRLFRQRAHDLRQGGNVRFLASNVFQYGLCEAQR